MIQPGSKLAHYEIVSALGKGGMGEVWRARDTKLGREVAVKTLPTEFAQNADRLARFEREAKLLASLNHPNVAAIYGLEEHEGSRFLVLELVEGDTLADRLQRGAIPVEESLKLALQIAEALEAAHEKGVVHRDLKPANIKVTPDGKVKVLDFGLAKALAWEQPDADLSNSPTLSMQATRQGVILGTAAYMSPEQAKGHAADKRADIWAFGCVLYESLTGTQVFAAEDASTILARVLEREPDYSALPSNLNPRLREIIERCLAKKAVDRYRDIGDVRLDIQRVMDAPNGLNSGTLHALAEPPSRSNLAKIAVATVGAAVATAGLMWTLRPVDTPLVSRLSVDLSEQVPGQVAISPDGRRIVYESSGRLFLRALEEPQGNPIPGSEGGITPFFSPDGEWIAFFTPTEIRKVRTEGGEMTVLSDFLQGLEGVWSSDDQIIFGQGGPTGLFQIDATGGSIETFAELGDYGDLDYPSLLPGGEWVIYTALVGPHSEWNDAEIVAQSITSGERKIIHEGGHYARYVPTGHLVFTRYGQLFAVRFDAERVEKLGEPVLLAGSVDSAPIGGGMANWAVGAQAGTLAFVPATTQERRLAIVDDDGSLEYLSPAARPYTNPRVSPDGQRALVQTDSNGVSEIWMFDLSANTDVQRLPQDGNNRAPIWTPDGESITFASDRDGPWGLYVQPADGSSGAELLTMAPADAWYLPSEWSPDGRFLMYSDASAAMTKVGIFDSETGENSTLLGENSENLIAEANFSPDGNWIVYMRQDGALFQTMAVYVQPFPPDGVERRVAGPFASYPVWSGDGGTIIYRAADRSLRTVGVTTLDGVLRGNDQLFHEERTLRVTDNFYRNFDAMPDGRVLVVIEPSPERIDLVLNWFEVLSERVPID